jgi:hypothetical protein
MSGKLIVDPSDKRPPVAPVLPAPHKQADHHRQVRAARQSEVMEDYVELIADLIDSTGEARSVDIAKRLGVTTPTVARMIALSCGFPDGGRSPGCGSIAAEASACCRISHSDRGQ